MKIKLIKEYEEYKAGGVFECEDADGQQLIDDGIAEKYVKPQVKLSPEETDLIRAEVSSMLEIKKRNEPEVNMPAIPKSDESEIEKTGGFKSFGHFVHDVYKTSTSGRPTQTLGKWGEIASKQAGMNEGVGSEGGFLVPTEFRSTLMRDVLGGSQFLSRCMQIPMATNSIEIPTVNETTRADGTWYGGVRVYNVAEGGTITDSKPKFSKVRLQLIKKAALFYATNEILEDSPISLEPLVNSMVSEAIYKHIDDEILHGNGAGQFLGILNSPSIVTQDAEANQVAGTIVTQNILNMWSRLKSRSHGNAVWITNQTTFPQLATLALEVGAAGAPAGLLQQSTNGVTGRPIYTLLGAPLIVTEHASSIGSVGDIVLADFRQYLIGQKAGGSVAAATSMHLRFLTDEMAFRFTLRMDGQPWEQSALTPKRGTPTLSSFVTLAAR